MKKGHVSSTWRDSLLNILREADQYPQGKERIEALRQLARQEGFRLRQLRLISGWEKSDGGWIIAQTLQGAFFLAEPHPSGYRIADDPRGQHFSLATVQEGYAVYPALPDLSGAWGSALALVIRFAGIRGLFALLLWSALAGVVTMALPVGTSILFTDVIPRDDRLLFAVVVKVLLIFTLANAGFQLIRGIAVIRLEVKLGVALEAAVWDRLLRLPANFFRRYTTADLASRASAVTLVQSMLSSTVINALLGFFFALGNFIVMVAIAPTMALVAVGCIFAAATLIALISWRTLQAREVQLNQDGALTATGYGLLQAVTKLRTAGALSRVQARWRQDYENWQETTFRLRQWQNLLSLINLAWPVLLSMAIFWLGNLVFDDPGVRNPHSGSFIAFYTAMGTFSGAFFALLQAVITTLDAAPLLKRMRPILTAIPEAEAQGMGQHQLQGEVALSRVTFAYTPEQSPVLRELSFTAHPGEFIAVTGPSGSGKTTLLRMLLGFDEPQAGQVLYDGQDLATLNRVALRRQLGVVLQNGQLLPDTILANIAGARPMSVEDAWEAAESAAIADDIRGMPMGMYTYISESSRTISGGQRQRLLIARALAMKPRLVIFDEATSALDNHSQRIVEESLARLKVTRIVIAHRLSTILHCDRILFLHAGKIAEDGTYQELMAQKGLFYQLAKGQVNLEPRGRS